VDASKTFFEEQFCKALAIDVQSADETTHLIRSLDIDFHIPLHAAAVSKIVGFLAKGLRFLVFVSSGARGADAREDEGEFGVLSWDENGEARAGFDEVDDCGYFLLALENGGLYLRFL